MKINRRDLGEYAQTYLQVLDLEGVENFETLRALEGANFPTERSGHKIVVEWRPSEISRALTTSYVIRGAGIPIELRMNKGANIPSLL
jgi:hypothetical protein